MYESSNRLKHKNKYILTSNDDYLMYLCIPENYELHTLIHKYLHKSYLILF